MAQGVAAIGAFHGAWDSGKAYVPNDEVVGSDTAYYLCIAPNTNQNPVTDVSHTYWIPTAVGTPGPMGPALHPMGGYDPLHAYSQGDLVGYLGACYASLQNTNTGHTPSTSPTWWMVVVMPSPPEGWFDVKTYGALGNGSGNDSDAIQAALNDAMTEGGTVYIPPGTYMIGTPLVVDQYGKHSFSIKGAGGRGHLNAQSPTLIYTAASGQMLTLSSCAGLDVSCVRFAYNDAGYGNVLVNMEWSATPGHESDCTDNTIHDCSFTGIGASGAEALLRLQHSIISSVERCHFGSAVDALRLGQQGAGYLANVQIKQCTFNNTSSRYIGIDGADNENLLICECAFENNPANGCIGYLPGYGFTYNVVIRDNWIGDVTGSSPVIQGLSDLYAGTLSGNRITGNGDYLISFSNYEGVVGDWLLMGNSFEGAARGILKNDVMPDGLTCISNNYNTTGYLTDGSRGHDAVPAKFVSLGNRKHQGSGTKWKNYINAD
jgi:Pectate lyase superfamily protein